MNSEDPSGEFPAHGDGRLPCAVPLPPPRRNEIGDVARADDGDRTADEGDRDARAAAIAELVAATGAELVQSVGNVALLYRPAAEGPKLVLPSR